MADQQLRLRLNPPPNKSQGPKLSFGTTEQLQEFANGDFRWNSRLWAAALPCILILCSFGDNLSIGLVIGGVIVIYMLDMGQQGEGALIMLWIVLTGLVVSFWVAAIPLLGHSLLSTLFLMFNIMAFLFLLGVWGALQFRWVQAQSPRFTLLLERLLFALFPVSTSTIGAWAWVAALGGAHAHFPLLLTMLVQYLLLSRPLQSSFLQPRSQPSHDKSREIQGTPREELAILRRSDSRVLAVLVVSLPSLLFVSVHSRPLLSGSALAWAELLLLPSFSFTCLALGSPYGTLWWLRSGNRGAAGPSRVERGAVLLCSTIGLASFHRRVTLHSFRHYLSMGLSHDHALPAALLVLTTASLLLVLPILLTVWGYVLPARRGAVPGLVNGILYSMGGSSAMGRPPVMKARVARAVFTMSGVLGVLLFSAALGFPWYLGAAVGASVHLASSFYFCRHPLHYAMFVVTTAAAATWFCYHNFWELDFSFVATGISLQAACAIIVIVATFAASIPGLLFCARNSIIRSGATSAFSWLAGVTLLLNAVGMTVIEMVLFVELPRESLASSSKMYPGYFLIFTSLSAVYLGNLLRNYTPPVLAWCATSIHVAKLALLLQPTQTSLLHALLVVLVFSAPYVFVVTRSQAGAIQALLAIAGAGGALVGSQSVIISPVLEVLLGSAPSLTATLTVALFFWSVHSVLIVHRCFPGERTPRRLASMLFVFPAALLLLQPELDAHSSASALSFTYSAWPSWGLLLAIAVALTLLAFNVSVVHSRFTAVLFSGCIGFSVAPYLISFALPVPSLSLAIGSRSLTGGLDLSVFGIQTVSGVPSSSSGADVAQFGLCVIFVLYSAAMSLAVGLLLFSTSRGQKVGGQLVPFTFALLQSIFALIYLIQALLFQALPRAGGIDLNVAGQITLFAFFSALNASIAVFLSASPRSTEIRPIWLVSVANAAVVLAFGQAFVLSRSFFGVGPVAGFLLSPLMLLLHPAPVAYATSWKLANHNRVAPVIAITSISLCIAVTYRLLLQGSFEFLPLSTVAGASSVSTTAALLPLSSLPMDTGVRSSQSWLQAFLQADTTIVSFWATGVSWVFVKNLALFTAAIPSHVLFVSYIWTRNRQSQSTVFLLLPLCLPGIFLSDLISLRWFSCTALAMSAIQLFLGDQQFSVGMSLI